MATNSENDRDAVQYSPKEMETGPLYHLLTCCVSPRPIAFVSTTSDSGLLNLAPFSYFALGGLAPPSVVFCPVNDRHGQAKDTLENIREVGEYVINVVTEEMAERMNQTSARYPRGISEFAEVGFTPVESSFVRPPRVGESPISLECRLHEVVTHGPGPLAGNYVIGEILAVHVSRSILDENGNPEPTRIDFIGRMGLDYYVRTRDGLFLLERPST